MSDEPARTRPVRACRNKPKDAPAPEPETKKRGRSTKAEAKTSKAKKAKTEAPAAAPASDAASDASSPPATPPPAKKAKAPKAADPAYDTALEEARSMTTEALKEACRRNDQAVGGTVQELVKRVADGIARGALPKCPKCFGGRPKKTGAFYKCPGFYDEDHFKRCSFRGTDADMPRTPWVKA
eukprot:gnl/Hemi2/24107_TR8089_c0_g2_i1.p1 gnl/Hemi2/24107_TR8089_c0_g2~~gnl/Hemi2/24107_TR8089_c0_g2_i1.p1  ORF type:complete len:183 (+),score=71.34 gnl/Hemi2/24107_TR8089_c0_g2_i1:66-614(+)